MILRMVLLLILVSAAAIGIARGEEADAVDMEQAKMGRLREELRVAVEDRQGLQHRLDEVASAARHDLQQLRQGLASARLSAKKELEKERHEAQFAETRARKAESATQVAETRARKAETATLDERKQRLSLLEKFSDMSQDLIQERRNAANASAEIGRLRKSELQTIAKQRQVLEARANASVAAAAKLTTAAQNQVASLRGTVTNEQLKLRAALVELDKSGEAADSKLKEMASMTQRLHTLEKKLQNNQEELAASQRGQKNLQGLLETSHAEEQHLLELQQKQQKEIASLNASNAELDARSRENLRKTMIDAARKVDTLEDEIEELKTKSDDGDASLAKANSDITRLHKALDNEESARKEASQQAADFQRATNMANATAKNYQKRATQLAAKMSLMQEDKDRLAAALEKKSKDVQRWREEAQERDEVADQEQGKIEKLGNETAALEAQLSTISPRAQRAEDLEDMLASLRTSAAHNASLLEKLKEQVTRLRDLKEQYSQDYDVERNETAAIQTEAVKLRQQLQSAQSAAEILKRQRDAAKDQIKESRSQVDEYFDENTKQQQQIDALTKELSDATAAANRSEEANEGLRARVEDLKEGEAHEKEDAHAAWISSQNELARLHGVIEVSSEAKASIEAELARTRAVLDDRQRKLLGLPTAAAATKPGEPTKPQRETAAVTAQEATRLPQSLRASSSKAPVPSTLQRLSEIFATPTKWHF